MANPEQQGLKPLQCLRIAKTYKKAEMANPEQQGLKRAARFQGQKSASGRNG